MSYRRLVPLLRQPGVWRCYSARRTDEEVMNVFDRKAKRRQKNRAALAENVGVYDYLKDEVRITVVKLGKNNSCIVHTEGVAIMNARMNNANAQEHQAQLAITQGCQPPTSSNIEK